MNKWLGWFLVFLFFSLALISVFFGNKIRSLDIKMLTPTQTLKPTEPVGQARITVVAENLEIPWGLAFLPDGSILFTERPGRVRLISKEGSLRQQPIATISDVKPIGEGGLLGIAVNPEFEKNNFIYFYYTYENNNGDTKNRVVRYKFESDSLTDRKIIVDGISGNSNHDGGRIKFGPDGLLYITTGDSENPSYAQDLSVFAGKILRVVDPSTSSGQVKNEIYSYGHRNPQGVAWDDRGRLWATEHGRSVPLSGFDELNLIEKGKNYGWPTIQGDQGKDGMVIPVINSGATTTWAPSGAAFYQGSIFFGGLRGQGLYEAVISGNTATLKKHLDGELGRIRDVVLGPDNMLYITTSNRDGRGTPKQNDDKILKIDPQRLQKE
jgi:glucose/arabinose dehydrogenase